MRPTLSDVDVRAGSRPDILIAATLPPCFTEARRNLVVFRSLSPYRLPTLLAPFYHFRALCLLVIQRLSTLLSAAGAVCGIGGTALLAAHPDQTTTVFALYSGSALAWMGVGYMTQQRWLLASNAIYFALALKGLMF